MNAIRKWLSVLSLVLCFGIFSASSAEFQAELHKADQIKSSDSKEFFDLLKKIEPDFDSLSISEKYYFLYLKGYESALKGDLNAAEKNYLHVFSNAQRLELKFRTALSMVNVQAFKRNWAEGLKFVQYLENNKDSISNQNVKHQGLIAIAIFYDEIEFHSVMIDYLRTVLDESNDGRSLCIARGLYLKAKRLLEHEIKSQAQFHEAIETCTNANETFLSNVFRSHLALYYMNNNKPEDAISLMSENMEAVEKSNYQLLIIESYSILARAYYSIGDKKLSQKYAKLAVEKEQLSKNIKPIAHAYYVLYQLELASNNLQKAIEYLQSYFNAEKRHFEEINSRQLAVESAKRRSAEKDAKIESLNKQNQILKLEKELSDETANYNRWIIFLLAISVTLLIAWTVYVKRAQRKLKYLAEYDSLTGISNRAYFTQSAETVLGYYSKSSRTASLILFDLDNFKRINDTHGHPAGDQILKLAAGACKECVRKVDVFGRVGGEEFAILLPGCEPDQAQKIAEECRKKVSEVDTQSIGMDSPVTASFGVADSQSSGYLLKDLIANADEAMYLAKRRGRNRVVSHSPE